jgi:hypothetical protein
MLLLRRDRAHRREALAYRAQGGDVKIAILLVLTLAGCRPMVTCQTCVDACKPFAVTACQPIDNFAIDCKCAPTKEKP